MSDVDTAPEGAEVAPAIPETQEQESSQTTGEQVDTQQEEKPRDEKGRFVPQERVNEITRARREAERRAESLERELATYRQQQPAQYTPQAEDKPPAIEDFDFDMARWGQAVIQHATKQAEAVARREFSQQDMQRHQQTVAQSFNDRAQKYAADHPDFDASISELTQTVQFRPEVVEVIGLSDHGPAVAHYLAKHLDEADRISRMSPHMAAAQLGRIEAQVSAVKPKPVTNAPAPAPVLSGGGAVQKDPERMSTDEWVAWRRASLKK